MIKVTLFSTDEKCDELGSVEISHMSMFEKDMRMTLRFLLGPEQVKFIELCIKHYILIQIQGQHVSIISESHNFQRVRFRFDAVVPKPS